jgi:hypothetical protein
MYSVYSYESNTMKPVEIVLRKEGREMRENNAGVNLT